MKTLKVINPFEGCVDRVYEYSNTEQALSTVKQLKIQQVSWSMKTCEQRVAHVLKCLTYFEVNKQTIASDISLQMGRPQHQAIFEVDGMLDRARFMCSISESTLKTKEVSQKPNFYRAIAHEPFGVVFTIAAWNYPLLVAVNSIVPALLSGNTVLLKHSGQTPEVGLHFERAFDVLVKNVILDHATTGQVIESGSVNHVVFTGSVNGGKQILRHCAESLITPGLELGGKDGVFVNNDADVDDAVESIVDGAMFNSGQSCCGVERVYVHEKVFDEFVLKAKTLMSDYKLGDPKSKTTNMGPLFKSSASKVMSEQVNEATTMGAKVLVGGEELKINEAIFFAPTLIVDVNHKMRIMNEENFGPIMPVMKVPDINTALELINDSVLGLTAAIFTKNRELADTFAQKVQVGTVFMNRCDYLDPELPWTGYKNSGRGSSLSKFGFYNLTQNKSIHFKQKLKEGYTL